MAQKDRRMITTDTSVSTRFLNFDVPFVSQLSHHERSSFKPIYSMTKWWARRPSSAFRATLLSLGLDASSSFRDAFYDNHQCSSTFDHGIILDPFMGGGTTIVEALRLGHKAIGVDLNPVAWFSVKVETTQTSEAALKRAFRRIEKKVGDDIFDYYTTTCPCCNSDARAIHTFWVKLAPCSHEDCDQKTPLFRDYIIGRRRNDAPVEYFEVDCPSCKEQVHCELTSLHLASPRSDTNTPTNQTRMHTNDRQVSCPTCSHQFTLQTESLNSKKKKKVKLHALICPDCWEVYQVRGDIPDIISCPSCQHEYDPHDGTTTSGKFTCASDHVSTVTGTIEANNLDEPLSFKPFGIELYCPTCAGKTPLNHEQGTLFQDSVRYSSEASGQVCATCDSVNHKMYKSIDDRDRDVITAAREQWELLKNDLPYPTSRIHNYQKTNRLVIHNYKSWHQLFNPRQLLALGLILNEIKKEEEKAVREALVAAFLSTLSHQNMLNTYYVPYAQSAGAFGRHDYHPKVTTAEGIPFGAEKGRGTFRQALNTVIKGKQYLRDPYDRSVTNEGSTKKYPGDSFDGNEVDTYDELRSSGANLLLRVADSTNLDALPNDSVDHVVTDPPYADAVQYAELADFFYVWLREALLDDYPAILQASETPKSAEIVENDARGKSQQYFYDKLQKVFSECHRVLKENGLLCFTFHHSRRNKWSDLLSSVEEAGFQVVAAYPIKSEATGSGNLVFHSNPNSAAYDVMLICESKTQDDTPSDVKQITWQDFKDRTLSRALEHAHKLQLTGAGGHSPSSSDLRMIVWGDCIASYAQAEETVVDEDGNQLALEDALGRLKNAADIDKLNQET